MFFGIKSKKEKAKELSMKFFKEELSPQLKDFLASLNSLTNDCPNPLDRIVRFFNITSEWQDKIGDISEKLAGILDNEFRETKKTLFDFFEESGRCNHGWNRTSKGQQVTDDNVYLGDVYGLFTKTVAHWKTSKDDKKGGWGYSGMEDLNPYDVVSRQAAGFINSWVKPYNECVNKLEKCAR